MPEEKKKTLNGDRKLAEKKKKQKTENSGGVGIGTAPDQNIEQELRVYEAALGRQVNELDQTISMLMAKEQTQELTPEERDLLEEGLVKLFLAEQLLKEGRQDPKKLHAMAAHLDKKLDAQAKKLVKEGTGKALAKKMEDRVRVYKEDVAKYNNKMPLLMPAEETVDPSLTELLMLGSVFAATLMLGTVEVLHEGLMNEKDPGLASMFDSTESVKETPQPEPEASAKAEEYEYDGFLVIDLPEPGKN